MLLPYSTDQTDRPMPRVVVGLVLFHFAVYGFVAWALSRSPASVVDAYARFALVPGRWVWYTPISYSILHQDVFHLSVNMLFLWVFGSGVEAALGWYRFIIVYIAGAVITGMTEVAMVRLMSPNNALTPIIGASGAVSALLGMFAVRYYRTRIKFIGLPGSLPAVVMLALVLVGEMGVTLYKLTMPGAGGLAGTSAHWAHITGFLLGIVGASLLGLNQQGKRAYMQDDAQLATVSGNYGAAVRRWEQLISANPQNLDYRLGLARAYAAAGEGKSSMAIYSSIVSELLTDNAARAAQVYTESLERGVQPRVESGKCLVLAQALERAGKGQLAIGEYERAFHDGTNLDASRLSAFRVAHICLEGLKQPKEAVMWLERYLKIAGDDPNRLYAEDMLRKAKQKQSENTK